MPLLGHPETMKIAGARQCSVRLNSALGFETRRARASEALLPRIFGIGRHRTGGQVRARFYVVAPVLLINCPARCTLREARSNCYVANGITRWSREHRSLGQGWWSSSIGSSGLPVVIEVLRAAIEAQSFLEAQRWQSA